MSPPQSFGILWVVTECELFIVNPFTVEWFQTFGP
jgi:hypothetical protein